MKLIIKILLLSLCLKFPASYWLNTLSGQQQALLALIVFILCVLMLPILGLKLIDWAKKRKTSAVIFGAAVQMFLPDPCVDKTIKIVQEQKQEVKKQQHDSEDNDALES